MIMPSLEQSLTPFTSLTDPAQLLLRWRTRLLNGLLLGLIVLGLPALVFGVVSDFMTQPAVAPITTAIYCLIYLFLLVVTFIQQIGFYVRALVLLSLLYAVGALFFSNTALYGDGRPFLFAFVMVSAALFGLTGGVIALLLTTLTMAVFGWLFVTGTLALRIDPLVSAVAPAYWASATISMVLTIVAAMITNTYLSRQLARAATSAEQSLQMAAESTRRAEERARELMEQTERLTTTEQMLRSLIDTLEVPVVPLVDDVVLAPIVGAVDSRRAHAITKRLLHVAGAQRTRLVIIDIGGLTTVDTMVVRALRDTARALQLIGCRVALTGISPAIATTFAELNVSLNDLMVARSPREILTSIAHLR